MRFSKSIKTEMNNTGNINFLEISPNKLLPVSFPLVKALLKLLI